MRFEADLAGTVDGRSFHVRGDGATLVVDTDDPSGLVATLRDGGTRRDLIVLADRLAERGISIEVHGQRGSFLTMGAETDSRALGLIAGSRHVAPGSARRCVLAGTHRARSSGEDRRRCACRVGHCEAPAANDPAPASGLTKEPRRLAVIGALAEVGAAKRMRGRLGALDTYRTDRAARRYDRLATLLSLTGVAGLALGGCRGSGFLL